MILIKKLKEIFLVPNGRMKRAFASMNSISSQKTEEEKKLKLDTTTTFYSREKTQNNTKEKESVLSMDVIQPLPVSSNKCIVCYEKWDFDAFERIRQMPMANKVTSGVLNHIDLHSLIKNGRVRVHYTTKGGFSEGRMYGFLVKYDKQTKQWIEVGAALQRLPGWIRNFIAHENYRDFDIVNCAPTLLTQILVNNSLCPKELTSYLTNREGLYAKYSTIPKKEIKTAFLKVFHMGASDPRISETVSLKKAIRKAMTELSLKTEYKTLFDSCTNEKNNRIGSFTGKVWQKEESLVLMQIRDYLSTLGYDPSQVVLCFDGIMLENNESVKDKVILEELENYVFQKTGYRIKIEEKSLKPTEKDVAHYDDCREKLRDSQDSIK